MAVPVANKRNVALLGHGGSGKTTLAEALLNYAGVTTRMGTIEEGNTVSDYHPEELKRRYSIYSTVLPFNYNGLHYNVVDCPGYLDFIGEAISALSVVEGAVILVNGVAGIEPQTRQAWRYAEQMNVARAFFISQLDKENSSYSRVLEQLRAAFGKSVVPFVIPVGEQSNLKSVVNVLNRKVYSRQGSQVVESDPPAEMSEAIEAARTSLIESIVELDDALMERYMLDEAIGEEELLHTLLEGVKKGAICPVVGGSAKQNIGMGRLLELIHHSLPDPSFHGSMTGQKPNGGEDTRPLSDAAPFSAQIFKLTLEGQLGEVLWMRVLSGSIKPGDTVYNPRTGEQEKISTLLVMRGKTREDVPNASAGDLVATVKLKGTRLGDTLCLKESAIIYPEIHYPSAVSYEAVNVEDKNDLEKVISALHVYSHMDPTFKLHQEEETKEMLVYGMGPLHIDVAANYVKNKNHVQVQWKKPRIAYRETITSKAEAQGKFKKQTGGRGKFGDAHIRLEALERGTGFEFVDAVVGGVIPNRFIPAVEKGIIETMEHGPLSGSRVIDLRATVFFGSAHSVDSDELSFKMAGRMGFKLAFEKAGPILLEPVYNVTIYTPEHYMGDIMGDLNTRRGRVSGMEQSGDMRVLVAQVPLAELYQYINSLRSMTQGQGYYEMAFSHYEQVPSNVQAEIVKHHQATAKKDDDE